MSIYTNPPEWEDAGKKPPSSKRTEGWRPGDRVPASWLNWGSPPRVRERPISLTSLFILYRITPACAGKTSDINPQYGRP